MLKRVFRKKLIRYLLTIIVICSLGQITISACAQEEAIIRVGVWSKVARFEQDEYGNFLGSEIEILNKMQTYFEYKIEYVIYNNAREAENGLENEEVDLILSMIKTEERLEKYRFSKHMIGYNYYALITLKENKKYSYKDTENIKDARIGYNYATGNAVERIQYLMNMGNVNEYIEYTTYIDLHEDLQQGKIDLFLGVANTVNKDEKIIDLFSPSEIYIITRNNEIEFMNQIDHVIEEILLEDPAYFFNVQEKYFPMFTVT